MAHRFNSKTGRVEPKPSASERTFYRWRMRKGIDTEQDKERKSRLEETLDRVRAKRNEASGFDKIGNEIAYSMLTMMQKLKGSKK